MLAALKNNLVLGRALSALQTKDNLLGGLGLLVEDRLGLTAKARLLPVITTLAYFFVKTRSDAIQLHTLSENGSLTSLVLSDLVVGVLLALLTWAEGLSGLGDVDLR